MSIDFIEHTGGYASRTKANALWSDITIAFAVDFSTGGERNTAKYAGEKLVKIPIPQDLGMLSQDEYEEFISVASRRILSNITTLSSDTPLRINIAGNRLAIFHSHGIRQGTLDKLVYDAFTAVVKGYLDKFIIRSGGQSGSDEAGIKAAMHLGIPCSVLAPKGWRFSGETGREIEDEKLFKERFYEYQNMKPELNKCSLFDIRKTEEGTTFMVETNVIPKDFSIMSFIQTPDAEISKIESDLIGTDSPELAKMLTAAKEFISLNRHRFCRKDRNDGTNRGFWEQEIVTRQHSDGSITFCDIELKHSVCWYLLDSIDEELHKAQSQLSLAKLMNPGCKDERAKLLNLIEFMATAPSSSIVEKQVMDELHLSREVAKELLELSVYEIGKILSDNSDMVSRAELMVDFLTWLKESIA